MRTLAQYTVYRGQVFTLHTFDVVGNVINHFETTEETADTYYVHGIAMIGDAIGEGTLKEINYKIKQLQCSSYSQYDIAKYLTKYNKTYHGHPHIYLVSFPLIKITELQYLENSL